jgi:NTE family protein
VGIAWEAGLLVGLAEKGVEVARAEWIVGTSAGAFVGAMLAAGVAPDDILAGLTRAPSADEISSQAETPADKEARPALPDARVLGEIFQLWGQAEVLDHDVRRRIASLSVDAAGDRVNPMLGRVERFVPGDEWPDGFEATAVSHTGEFVLFGPDHGVPLDAAVAASCAVPGIFPPVEIDGAHFVDGGVRSGTSADVLIPRAPSHVLIVAPLSNPESPNLGAVMDRCMRSEMKLLADAGIACYALVPDEADRAAFGPNMMDPSRQQAAREAGLDRGRREAGSASLEGWLEASARN